MLSITALILAFVAAGSVLATQKLPIQPGMLLNVKVGSPPQDFKILIDTASAKTWLLVTDELKDRNFFHPPESSTFRIKDSYFWTGIYSQAIVRARQVGFDDWRLGNTIIKDQEFALISQVQPPKVGSIYSDGSIGLGLKNEKDSRPFIEDPFENLFKKQQFGLNERLFSIYLNKSFNAEPFGHLILGGIDEKLFEGEITYLQSDEHWDIPLDSIATKVSSKLRGGSYRALIDTTSNIIKIPKLYFDYLVEPFRTRQTIRLNELPVLADCNMENQPDLVFGIHKQRFIIPAEDLLIQIYQPYATEKYECYLAIAETNGDEIVLGTPFLKNYYTIFDYSNKRVGIAKSKQFDPTSTNAIDKTLTSVEINNILEKIRRLLNRDYTNSEFSVEMVDETLDESGDICGICLSGFKKTPAWNTKCDHKFHKSCLSDHFNQTSREPRCFFCNEPLVGKKGQLLDSASRVVKKESFILGMCSIGDFKPEESLDYDIEE